MLSTSFSWQQKASFCQHHRLAEAVLCWEHRNTVLCYVMQQDWPHPVWWCLCECPFHGRWNWCLLVPAAWWPWGLGDGVSGRDLANRLSSHLLSCAATSLLNPSDALPSTPAAPDRNLTLWSTLWHIVYFLINAAWKNKVEGMWTWVIALWVPFVTQCFGIISIFLFRSGTSGRMEWLCWVSQTLMPLAHGHAELRRDRLHAPHLVAFGSETSSFP